MQSLIASFVRDEGIWKGETFLTLGHLSSDLRSGKTIESSPCISKCSIYKHDPTFVPLL